MKRIILALFFLTSPAWATFTVVQHVNNHACGTTTTCALTVSSTGSGNVGVIVFISTVASKSISSISGGGTWTHCTTCTSTSTHASADISYILSLTGSVTTITVTFTSSATTTTEAEFFEFSFTGSSVAFDTGNFINNDTNTLRGGVDLTALAGSNDVLVQGITPASNVNLSAINGAYSTSDFAANGSFTPGFAAAINSTTGTAPTWTFSANAFSAGTGIAIKEATPAATSTQVGGFLVGP